MLKCLDKNWQPKPFKMQKEESITEVQKRFTHIVNNHIGLGKEFHKEELNIKVLKCLNRNWQPKPFKMQKGESIAEVQKRFTHIVNHLMGLGKEFDKEELNIKVLKFLDRNWQPKVTAISKSMDLSIITTTALFGKLREHEIEMQRLIEFESSEKRLKIIALKASSKKSDETEEEAAKSSDNENLNLLVKRFGKYLKRKGNKGNQRRYIYKQNYSSNTSKFSCYNYGKQGHIKIECPNVNKEKEKVGDRKKVKERRAYIAWKDNDDSRSIIDDFIIVIIVLLLLFYLIIIIIILLLLFYLSIIVSFYFIIILIIVILIFIVYYYYYYFLLL